MKDQSEPKILRASGGTGLLKLGQAVTGIAVGVVLARLLGPSGYGIYAIGFSIATILAIPVKNGLGELIVREVASGTESRNWAHVSGFLAWIVRLTGAYLVLASLLIGGGAMLFIWMGRPTIAYAALAGMLILPGFAFLGIASGGVRATGRPFAALLPDAVFRPVLFLISILVVAALLQFPVDDPYLLFGLHALASLLCAIGLWLFLQSKLPPEVRATPPKQISGKSWFYAAFAFSAVGGLMVLNRQIDLLVLGLISGEKDAGIYRVAIQGGMLITFGLQAVSVVVSPLFARGKESDRHSERWALMRSSVLISTAVAFPGLAFMILFGEPMLALLFGDAFRPAYAALVVLSAANAAAALNGAIIPLLNMTGHEEKTLKSFGVAVLTNSLSAIVLVQFFGLIGAAFAALLSTVVWSVILRQVSIRHLGIDPVVTIFRRHP